ncbi:MAG: hypothetical protein WBC04_24190, partial [Candidatus Acidiferrales bacterium]
MAVLLFLSKEKCTPSLSTERENRLFHFSTTAGTASSALPLKALETNFACDSSGFSGCRYDRWIEHKYGSPMKKVLRAWVKTHIMCGVKTNVVTA